MHDACGSHIFFSSTTMWVPRMELRFSGMVTGSYINLAQPSYWIQMCPSSIWCSKMTSGTVINKLVITETYSWVLWVLVIKFQTCEGGSCGFLFVSYLDRRMGNPQTQHFLLIVGGQSWGVKPSRLLDLGSTVGIWCHIDLDGKVPLCFQWGRMVLEKTERISRFIFILSWRGQSDTRERRFQCFFPFSVDSSLQAHQCERAHLSAPIQEDTRLTSSYPLDFLSIWSFNALSASCVWGGRTEELINHTVGIWWMVRL